MSNPDATPENTDKPAASPPVPRYGEYAPPGWVSPVTGQEGTAGPVDGPAAPPAAPPAPAPVSSPSGYAAPQYVPGVAAPLGAPAPQGGPRTRKTWDLVLTIVFLVMGFFGAGFGVLYGFFLGPGGESFAEMGIVLPDSVATLGTILIASHILLYLAALLVSILLLVQRRLAFYVPLAAGVIAAIIYWSIIFPIFADPAVMEQFYNMPTS